MPQANLEIKRIISTDLNRSDNPLKSANISTLPFLVMRGGGLQPVNATSVAADWDVMILCDGENPGFDALNKPNGVTEVLWLHHNWNVTLKQELALRSYFGEAQFKLVPFSHVPNDYNRYLVKVAALWEKMSEDYIKNLTELDRALRSEQMESDICDFLWLWAAYRDAPKEPLNLLLRKSFIDKRSEVAKYVKMAGKDKVGIETASSSSSVEEYTQTKNFLKSMLEFHQDASLGASGS